MKTTATHEYDEDLLPENRINMRGEIGEDNGEPITIVLISARSNVKPFPDVFDPTKVLAVDTNTEKVSQPLDGLSNANDSAVLSVIEMVARLSREGKHREWLELVDDDEIRRFAGLTLVGRAQMKL